MTEKELLAWYEELVGKHGPQGWWPMQVGCWKNGRYVPDKGAGDSVKPVRYSPHFEVIVGAILTQNTAWRNVCRAIKALLEEKLLLPAALLEIPRQRLAELVRPSGYYNQKTDRLLGIARFIVNDYEGDAERFAAEIEREELLGLKGVGPETADSILLYAAGRLSFVVDSYTRRLLAEKGVSFRRYDDYRQFFMKNFPADAELYKEFHALIVREGSSRKRKKS